MNSTARIHMVMEMSLNLPATAWQATYVFFINIVFIEGKDNKKINMVYKKQEKSDEKSILIVFLSHLVVKNCGFQKILTLGKTQI